MGPRERPGGGPRGPLLLPAGHPRRSHALRGGLTGVLHPLPGRKTSRILSFIRGGGFHRADAMQTRNPRRSGMRAAGRPAAARHLYTVARAAAQDMANTPGRAVVAPSKPAQSAHWADAWFEATAEDLPAISASETLAAQLSQRGIKNNSLTGTLPDHQPRYKVGDTPVLDIS